MVSAIFSAVIRRVDACRSRRSMIRIAAQKLKHLTIELGWGFPVRSVPDLAQCDYLVLRQVRSEHALKRGRRIESASPVSSRTET